MRPYVAIYPTYNVGIVGASLFISSAKRTNAFDENLIRNSLTGAKTVTKSAAVRMVLPCIGAGPGLHGTNGAAHAAPHLSSYRPAVG